MANRAHVLYAKRDLRLEERPISIPGEGEVLLEIAWVGLCGSDVHQWADGGFGDKRITGPFVLGHEASAIVRHSNGTHLREGTRVAVEPGIGCGVCEWCKGGRYNLCPEMRFFSTLRPPNDGVLTHFKAHPARLCHPSVRPYRDIMVSGMLRLPDTVSLEEGAVVEPLSVAVHALNRANLCAGEDVLICGAGPVGLLCALLADVRGAGHIYITDINQKRLDDARDILPRLVGINMGKTTVEEVKASVCPSAVIECSGVGVSQASAIKVLLFHSQMGKTTVKEVKASVCPSAVIECSGVGMWKTTVKEVKASVCPSAVIECSGVGVSQASAIKAPSSHASAVELLGLVRVWRLITAKLGFEEAESGLEAARRGDGLKVLIRCRPQ